jgi:hypothetical protein
MPHGSTHPNRAGFERSEEDRPNPKLSDQILCDVHLMENFQIYIEFKLKFQFYTLASNPYGGQPNNSLTNNRKCFIKKIYVNFE